jgi:hypothetical protein
MTSSLGSPGAFLRTTQGRKRVPLPVVTVPADWAKAAPLPGRGNRELRARASLTEAPSSVGVPGGMLTRKTGDQAERWGHWVVRTLLFWSLASLIWSLAAGGR